jgi:hypothetical protein
MMLADALRGGFAQAHRRPGLIAVDALWKMVWLAATTIGFLIVFYQFISRLEFPTTSIRLLDGLVAANLLRQSVNDYGGEFIGGVIAVLGMSVLVYLVLEAKFRMRFVVAGGLPPAPPRRGRKPPGPRRPHNIGAPHAHP